MKKICKLLIACALVAGFVGNVAIAPAQADELKGKIIITGSSALLPLTLQAAKEFKQINPKVVISATASSSIAGPQAVKAGGPENIGACDWDASKSVPDFQAFPGQVAHKVAVIPFATVVNDKVKITNLTTEQLQGIFTGKILNWKEVGGEDAPIVVINRAFGSGTRVNYQITALKSVKTSKGKNSNYKEVKSSGDMFNAVKNTPNSIGYMDLVYIKSGVKAVNYNGIAPTTTNVINGSYPVWAYGYYMTKGQPTGATKAFIEYIQSNKFQQGSVKAMKFVPIAAMK